MQSAVDFIQIVPLLRIFDIGQALAFYIDYLGCCVDWEHRFGADMPLYMQVSRGKLMLHLTEHHGDCSPGATVFVRMTGIEALHQELLAKPYPYLKPGLGRAPWNALEMELTDPFGNRIRFQEDLPGEAQKPDSLS